MRTFFLTIITILSHQSFSQIYIVSDLSERFDFEIEIDLSSHEYFHEGKIRVFLKKRNKLLLEVSAEAFAFDKSKYTNSNIQISGTEQEVIVYRDFNFDGHKDLALQQYYSSKGPAYTIYLYNGTDFVKNAVFTEIILRSQGNYELLPNEKEILITGSGGCCYHIFSTYKIIDGYPFENHTIISEQDMPFNTETQRKWTSEGMVETVTKTANLDQEGIYPILSFKLKNKDKTVVLYNINNRMLYYVLLKNDNEVEFSLPIEAVYKQKDFVVTSNFQSINFRNEAANYIIYEYENDIGIIVKIHGKEYNLKGNFETKEGSLSNIPIETLDNVYMGE
ncbi:XAC2610-related protein [Tunicatimonas pelagia]|uniref:XAC2610-related protein n=1 Tax=Tunicatimonas pelagia TaxID=931531 RepID=UPI002665677C|nr:hypothetical protein [Tunicatimonas pelagia]WKN43569.1 hypothetical protein P0M28_01120 [Tunicatimonas pelagia]